MVFSFQKYGTFAGPGTPFEYRDNDDFKFDEGVNFTLSDVSMCLVNTAESPADYVYLHLNGSSTSSVTLERSTGQIPEFMVKALLTDFSGLVLGDDFIAGGKNLKSRKPFDIPHPTKDEWRLRHVCLEGPESAVYHRGRLKDSNIIELPEYWNGLVDAETITVNLTQIGYPQDLIVDKIEWGRRIVIKSGNGANIDCYFLIHGERKDGEKLIVEYKGTSISDYPGDNSIYSINK
jgi:hypothetical protein